MEHLRHRLDRCRDARFVWRSAAAANGGAAWFGWPDDEKLEALRTEWLKIPDSEARQEIAVKIQARAFETLPYIPNIPTGQWSPVTAYRKNLTGVIIAPALLMWNVENI